MDLEHNYDFSGYATKVGKKCSDGRTILKDAFAHDDGIIVPLVWQHGHDDVENILGHALLKNREDGVYTYCSLNGSAKAQAAKEAIGHKDIRSLSIFANQLVEKAKQVVHGKIREVSLVISGANPEALIDNIAFAHGDGNYVVSDEAAVIYAYEEIDIKSAKHAASEEEETVADVFNSMTEKQKTVVYALIGEAIAQVDDEEIKQSAIAQEEKGEKDMKQNLFSQDPKNQPVLSHSDLKAIVDIAKKSNGSLKEAFLAHAGTYGIDNIDYLFPDATAVNPIPGFLGRRTEWVEQVFGKAHHSMFSRIKSLTADITGDEARARGYVKGNEKVDEVFALLKRTTLPQTIYKKQKLDRDDIIDIKDFDVVSWLKWEMRFMLDEEIARAMLVGDGRSPASDDKIVATNIRPIYTDDALYSIKVAIEEAATTFDIIDKIVLARKDYRGSGNPTFFTTPDVLGDMLLLKDTTKRRIYNNVTDLASALRVSSIVEVPVMEGLVRDYDDDNEATLLGIVVNMQDYYVGADKGGAVSMFEDFDIDYNQQKYLIETRCSGALVQPKSAIVFEKLSAKPVG